MNPTKPAAPRRVYGFTGRFGSGKDHVAREAGLLRLSIADPLLACARAFLGSDDKSVPGVREFLQKAGLWFRGEVSPGCPLTVERAMFFRWLGEELFEEETARPLVPGTPRLRAAGLTREFAPGAGALVRIVLDRAVGAPLEVVPAVTNLRFADEIATFASDPRIDFVHVHVSARSELSVRREAAGYEPHGASDTHPGEHLAMGVDCIVERGFQHSSKPIPGQRDAIGIPQTVRSVYVANGARFAPGDRSPVWADHLGFLKTFPDSAGFAKWVRDGGAL